MQNREDLRQGEWNLGHLEACFDVIPMPSGPLVHVCAALPNARAFERWPNFPTAARPEAGRVANGCGLTEAASRRSGIGEAVELMKACVWGDEPLVRASARQLGASAIGPEDLNGFSPDQMIARARENYFLAGRDWIPAPFRDDALLDWIEADEPGTGGRLYVPAAAVLIGLHEAGDDAAVAVSDSNGCACAPTAEAAKLSALLELIERDAAARWWYGQRQRRALDLSVLGAQAGLRSYLAGRRRRCALYDITTDLSVPVVAAASFEADGTVVAIGFAAKADLPAAALAASVEMLAVETSLPPWRDASDDALASAWVTSVRASDLPVFARSDVVVEPSPPANGSCWTLDACIGALLAQGCRVLFVDLSRGDYQAPVFKAISPELCHIRPRFGKARLYKRDARDLEPGGLQGDRVGDWPILL